MSGNRTPYRTSPASSNQSRRLSPRSNSQPSQRSTAPSSRPSDREYDPTQVGYPPQNHGRSIIRAPSNNNSHGSQTASVRTDVQTHGSQRSSNSRAPSNQRNPYANSADNAFYHNTLPRADATPYQVPHSTQRSRPNGPPQNRPPYSNYRPNEGRRRSPHAVVILVDDPPRAGPRVHQALEDFDREFDSPRRGGPNHGGHSREHYPTSRRR